MPGTPEDSIDGSDGDGCLPLMFIALGLVLLAVLAYFAVFYYLAQTIGS